MEALLESETLTALDLSDNRLTRASWEQLQRLLKGSRLKSLVLKKNPLAKEMGAEVQAEAKQAGVKVSL